MDELIYAGYDCRLTEEQKDMVSPFWFTIGRAYLFPENNYPCIIYNEKSESIGFINLCKWSGDEAVSWSFYIDKDHQGKGYGREAMKLALDFIRTFPCGESEYCWLSYDMKNEGARALYRAFGFVEQTDVYVEGGEMPAVLKL